MGYVRLLFPSLRLPTSGNWEKALILLVSFLQLPNAWLFFNQSGLSRSIRLSAPLTLVPLLWPIMDIWNTKCDFEEFLFIAILAENLYLRVIVKISYRSLTECTSTYLLFIVPSCPRNKLQVPRSSLAGTYWYKSTIHSGYSFESSLIPSWRRS